MQKNIMEAFPMLSHTFKIQVPNDDVFGTDGATLVCIEFML